MEQMFSKISFLIFLLLISIIFNAVYVTCQTKSSDNDEIINRVVENDLITSVQGFEEAILFFGPQILVLRYDNDLDESKEQEDEVEIEPDVVDSRIPVDYVVDRDKYFSKGVKMNMIYCDVFEFSNDRSVIKYEVVIRTICEKGREDLPEENSTGSKYVWRYMSLPYTETEDIQKVQLSTSEQKSYDADSSIESEEAVLEFLYEKTGVYADDQSTKEKLNFVTAWEISNSISDASKLALKTFPDIVSIIKEEDLHSFIGNTLMLNSQHSSSLNSYPLVFLSDSKVKNPPHLLHVVASFLNGLIKVAFVHNPSANMVRSIGLPSSTINKNSLMLFDSHEGRTTSFLYDRNMFGRYTAFSTLNFCINIFKSTQQQNSEVDYFNSWLVHNNNHLRLPIKLDFQVENSEPVEEDRLANKSYGIKFIPRDITTQINTEDLIENCFPSSENETDIRKKKAGSICFLGFFDRLNPDLDAQIAMLDKMQHYIVDSNLLGRVKPPRSRFKVFFGWVDSVCNGELLLKIGGDIASTPSIGVLKRTESNIYLSRVMVNAFTTNNTAYFAKEAIYRRFVLWGPPEKLPEYKRVYSELSSDIENIRLNGTCTAYEEAVSLEDDLDDMNEMLKEIQEEEQRQQEELEEELRREKELADKIERKKSKKKKKKRKKKSSKDEL